MNKLQKTLAVQAATMVLCLLYVSNADAEIRTITATGEYRMGDNDTRTDAKRLALLDAKQLALEQAGTYIESITQVKNFDLSKEEIRAYTAGIVEVTEQTTRDVMEGTTHIVRVDVTVKIDTDVVTQQIQALRQNETANKELLRLRAERDHLQQEVDAKTNELQALRSPVEVEALTKHRQGTLTKLDVEELVAQAWAAIADAELPSRTSHCSTSVGYAAAERFIQHALALDPDNKEARYLRAHLAVQESNVAWEMIRRGRLHIDDHTFRVLSENGKIGEAIFQLQHTVIQTPERAENHHSLGVLLALEDAQAGLKLPHLEEAIVHVCTAVRHHPDNGLYRHNFAVLLAANAQWGQAASEARAAVRLTPNDAQTHFLLGKILRTLDDRKGQIAEYRAAIRIRPDYREAFEALGNALIEEEDWDRAVAALRAALSLKPEKPKEERSVEDLHGDIGYALRQKGDLNGALAEYRLALATGSFFSGRNHLAIGHILTEKGDLTGAIKEYREAVRLESKYGELYVVNERLYLAHALTRTGDLDGAIAEVRLVRKRRDYYDFICGARIAGMYSHVEPAFRELLQKIPNVPENREVIEFVQVILREDKCAG